MTTEHGIVDLFHFRIFLIGCRMTVISQIRFSD